MSRDGLSKEYTVWKLSVLMYDNLIQGMCDFSLSRYLLCNNLQSTSFGTYLKMLTCGPFFFFMSMESFGLVIGKTVM